MRKIARNLAQTQKGNSFYDDVMQTFFIAPPFFFFFSSGLVDHPSIRALNPKVKSAHTLTSGPGPLTYLTMRPSWPIKEILKAAELSPISNVIALFS